MSTIINLRDEIDGLCIDLAAANAELDKAMASGDGALVSELSGKVGSIALEIDSLERDVLHDERTC